MPTFQSQPTLPLQASGGAGPTLVVIVPSRSTTRLDRTRAAQRDWMYPTQSEARHDNVTEGPGSQQAEAEVALDGVQAPA